MPKLSKIIMLIMLPTSLIASGCTTVNTKQKDKTTAYNTVKIAPFRSYEECVELLPKQIMEYSFNSSEPINFNIHYHTISDIFYPVSKERISSWKGSLRPEELEYYSEVQEYFCMMWDNPTSKRVSVTFECKVRPE